MAYFRGKYKESLRNHLRLKSLEIVKDHEDQTNYVILIKETVYLPFKTVMHINKSLFAYKNNHVVQHGGLLNNTWSPT